MTLLQLREADARVVYLATVYHLGRPGSELHPDTLQKHDLGLQAVHDAIVPELGRAVVEVQVSPYQLLRLGEALLGLTNELKQYAVANGRSMVPRFTETLHSLYPETADDPGAAMDLVQHPVMLRNRLAAAIQQAEADIRAARETANAERRAGRRWWQFWRRT